MASSRPERLCRETLPRSFMPRASRESPAVLNTVIPARTRYFRKVTYNPTPGLSLGRFRGRRLFLAVFLDPLVALRAQFKEGPRFFVQALAFGVVEHRFPQNAVRGLGTEIIRVVEVMDCLKDFRGGQTRILDLHHLVSAIVDHFCVAGHKAIFYREFVQFSSRVSMRHRNLDRLYVEFLGEVDRVLDGLASFSRQSEDEISVDYESQLVAILGELAGALDGRAFLDVLQNLLIARFVAHNQEPAARVFHGLERFEVGCDSRCARPGQAQRFQLGAQFDGACLLEVESVVVEEKFLHVRPVVLRLGHFTRYVVRGTLAPRMSTERL